MVCFDDGIICVPKNSITSEQLCLSADLKCDGEIDCISGIDEENCAACDCTSILCVREFISFDQLAVLTGGIKALIVIVVVAVVVIIPILYIVIQKKRGKPIIPGVCIPCWSRCQSSCGRSKDGDHSSQELASSSHGNVSNSSVEKDGFTNVGFDTGASHYNHSSSSPHKDPFNRYKKNVQETEEKLPSYRDWQVNRLQQATPDLPPDRPNGNIHITANQPQHQPTPPQIDSSRIPASAVIRTGPVTYSHVGNRVAGPSSNLPYAISTTDGQAKYESRSHAYRQFDYDPADHSSPRWNRPPEQHNSTHRQNENYSSRNTAVPPNELRAALERVSYHPNSQHHADHFSDSSQHDTSADTVV